MTKQPQPLLASDSSAAGHSKKRRVICNRCHRPLARACICAALPDKRITLRQCHVLAIQHPHEQKRKNRSLFLAELCIENITRIVTRKFHFDSDNIDADLAASLSPERTVWLVYPHEQAKSLRQALADQCCSGETTTSQSKSMNGLDTTPITLIFLDATWKFAAEMERASRFPPHTQYVCLDAQEDLVHIERPMRFDIRTPPSPSHLSTAECLALTVSRVEQNPAVYDTIMQPLDLMVAQWHSFMDANSNKKEEKTSNVNQQTKGASL